MKIGYARISTLEQNPNLQHDALKAAGCDEIYEDRLSGSVAKRRGLEKALARLGPDDVLVVWRLDRLGRSMPHLIKVVAVIGGMGAGFQSLTENIDTTTAGGMLIFHMMGALAQFERSLIVERTMAGLEAAKRRGVKVGRPKALSADRIRHARQLIKGGESPGDVAKTFGVSRATLYRGLATSSPAS